MNKIFAQLIENRHLSESFLKPKYEDLSDPFIFPDMKKATDHIAQAIEKNQKILIYGDYDVDGITASTLMYDTLTLAGAKSENLSIMLPNRFLDGYGMSPRLVGRAKDDKISLVITVDCGSRNFDIVKQLKAAKIDTIITDHHECEDKLPKEAIAVLNPKRHDFPKEPQKDLKNLAGVGVAFKLAQALVKQGRAKNGQEKWLLDLVLLGTICDQMPLTGENRILCFYGLKVLPKTRRLGLKELMRTAKIKSLNSDSIGFQLGPRLNAAGRLKSADLALNLLQAKDRPTASRLAAELEELNRNRKASQHQALSEIAAAGPGPDPVLVKTGRWHEGIVGIIAGQLTERYHRPAFVLTEVEGGLLKGSGRSFGDFSLAEALSAVKDDIIGGGGHAAAAGVKLESKNLPSFVSDLNAYYKNLHLSEQEKYFWQTPDLTLPDFKDLTTDLLDDLASLEPFGEGNSQPLFRLRDVSIKNLSRLGADQNHLRLDLSDRQGHNLKLLSFFAPKSWLTLPPDTKIEPLIRVEKNEFRGLTSLEGRIVDLNPLPS